MYEKEYREYVKLVLNEGEYAETQYISNLKGGFANLGVFGSSLGSRLHGYEWF